MQTKEAMQGELKFLQQELEAERSLTRQEREETSQQLLLTKQQYDSAFELQQSAHEVEIKKLLKDLLEEETEALSRRVDETERRKISEQEKLQLCERMNEELSAEKAHLEQLLKKAEEQEKGLQVELMALRKEKEESQEELQVSQQQQELVRSGLEELRQECCRQADALAKMSREKELLVQEKADLEVRLRDTEWDRRGLSEQLAEASWKKRLRLCQGEWMRRREERSLSRRSCSCVKE
ncbi:trichohyalin-like [Cuculus canorus]|uniref:trichohyalin-like n=1 Tax=Cuculus canorus TaxID=55661 RepID=UPI0023AA93DE|nr:trichohyalin-like [Cuculus canorus]